MRYGQGHTVRVRCSTFVRGEFFHGTEGIVTVACMVAHAQVQLLNAVQAAVLLIQPRRDKPMPVLSSSNNTLLSPFHPYPLGPFYPSIPLSL